MACLLSTVRSATRLVKVGGFVCCVQAETHCCRKVEKFSLQSNNSCGTEGNLVQRIEKFPSKGGAVCLLEMCEVQQFLQKWSQRYGVKHTN